MTKRALPVFRLQRTQKPNPATVERIEQIERKRNRSLARVVQFGPAVFEVRFDRRFIFGDSKLETRVGIQMTFRHVMNDLADIPAGGSISSIELFLLQTSHRCAHARWCFLDLQDAGLTLVVSKWCFEFEFSDRVTQIHLRLRVVSGQEFSLFSRGYSIS